MTTPRSKLAHMAADGHQLLVRVFVSAGRSAAATNFSEQILDRCVDMIDSRVRGLSVRVLLSVLSAGILMFIGQPAQSAPFFRVGHFDQQGNVLRAWPLRVWGDFADLSSEQKANAISDLVPLLPAVTAKGEPVSKSEANDRATHTPGACNPRNESGYFEQAACRECHIQPLGEFGAQEFGVFLLILLGAVGCAIFIFRLAQVFNDLIDWIFDVCWDAWRSIVDGCCRLTGRKK